uniref:Protein FAR1-RELATED SEQUENCE n=1 Tax=Solanum lycopersicum TaxID=4081 RepID=A0A3Q7G3E8_SOLLC
MDPYFLKHYFWAGMISTQKSELMHLVFDGYISKRSSLNQFVEQYNIALRYKYEKEFQPEANSQKKHAVCFNGFEWYLQLHTYYTQPFYVVFVAEHMNLLYNFEIERRHEFNVLEGVEK